MKDSVRVLLLDIETAPCLSYIWSLWQEPRNTAMLVKDWHVLCWCAKWLGEKKMLSGQVVRDNDKPCLEKLRNILDSADVVIAQNGDEFDIKKINTRLLYHNIPPPSPFRSVDTLKVARGKFHFTSNKLDDIARVLGLGRKMKTGGFELWRGVMRGCRASIRKMIKYCSQDVRLLEKVYLRMRPYIDRHPHVGILHDKYSCQTCGSTHMQRRGVGVNNRGRYRKVQCMDCGKWGSRPL